MIQTADYSDIGGRPDNEDSVREVRLGGDKLCAVVADGLGGHGGGKKASSTAAQVICESWEGEAEPQILHRLVQDAHCAVRDIQTDRCAMKSTVVMLAIRGRHAAWAHVGDTRLYHFLDGKKDFQTRDHSASQVAVVLGEITVDQIRFHEDRNRVLRALGQDGELKVETGERELEAGRHAFLLCTDGFWEYVIENEMEDCLRTARTPEEWIARMREILRTRVPEDNDNNTAAAVWLTVK